MKMKRINKVAQGVVEDAAAKLGWRLLEVERRGNDHLAFVITNGDLKKRVFTGSTPSDRRAMLNLASTVKKVIQRA